MSNDRTVLLQSLNLADRWTGWLLRRTSRSPTGVALISKHSSLAMYSGAKGGTTPLLCIEVIRAAQMHNILSARRRARNRTAHADYESALTIEPMPDAVLDWSPPVPHNCTASERHDGLRRHHVQ